MFKHFCFLVSFMIIMGPILGLITYIIALCIFELVYVLLEIIFMNKDEYDEFLEKYR